MTLTTSAPAKVIAILRKARVSFQVVRTKDAGELKGAQNPEVAQRIYDRAAAHIVFGRIAEEEQVSYATVLRVCANPEKYGVQGPPIRRTK